MSLVLAADPGHTPTRGEPCAFKTCDQKSQYTVRTRLGSRVLYSIRVCAKHRLFLEERGALESRMPAVSTCVVDNCNNPRARRGLCADHAAMVTRWPAGKSPVSAAFARDLAELRPVDPSAVPLGETAGQAEPAATEPERVVVVPQVVTPTTPPVMPHLPSVRLGMDQAATAMRAALGGQPWRADGQTTALVGVLETLETHMDGAHAAGERFAADAVARVLTGQKKGAQGVAQLEEVLTELAARLDAATKPTANQERVDGDTAEIAQGGGDWALLGRSFAASLTQYLNEVSNPGGATTRHDQTRVALIEALNRGPASLPHVPADLPFDEVVRCVQERVEMLREVTHDRNKVRARLAGVEDRLAAWVQQLNEAMYPDDATTKRDAEKLIVDARHWREVHTSLSSPLVGLWRALGSPTGHHTNSAWIVAEAERRLRQSPEVSIDRDAATEGGASPSLRWSPDVPIDRGTATEGGAVLRPSPALDVQELREELARSFRDGRHMQILPAPSPELRRWRLTLRDSSNPVEVEAVATDLGGLRLGDGTIIGPAAILRAEPLGLRSSPLDSAPGRGVSRV